MNNEESARDLDLAYRWALPRAWRRVATAMASAARRGGL
jgi:hypothetical protein